MENLKVLKVNKRYWGPGIDGKIGMLNTLYPNLEELWLKDISPTDLGRVESVPDRVGFCEKWGKLKMVPRVRLETHQLIKTSLEDFIVDMEPILLDLIETWCEDEMHNLKVVDFFAFDPRKLGDIHLTYLVNQERRDLEIVRDKEEMIPGERRRSVGG
ncbi:hypothetical protein TWF481_006387 [Arthrobotrys musiformis]|uniref:Uncharacterized protein n=1 Tax=Arthrobotrys musiformis TaxID=47236 RepID=A0AAV9WI55_9PEZI